VTNPIERLDPESLPTGVTSLSPLKFWNVIAAPIATTDSDHGRMPRAKLRRASSATEPRENIAERVADRTCVRYHAFMAHDPQADLASVLGFDVAARGTAELVAVLGAVRRLRGLLDSFEAGVNTRLGVLNAEGRSAPASDVLTRNANVSAKEAARRERRAKALAKARAFGDALAKGSVTAEHADVLADVTAKLDDTVTASFFDCEQELAAKAACLSPERFARHCRTVISNLERDEGIQRNKRQRRDTHLSIAVQRDGMHRISGLLHPELGAQIGKALDLEVATLSADNPDGLDRGQLTAVALGNLVAGGHQAARPLEADVLVLTDHTTVTQGLHEQSICETDTGAILPPETIRRLCCNGRITPILLIDGIPLNVGREQRLANRAQRRALRAIYRTCAFAGCATPYSRCEIHHLVPWELGGVTDLANLLPLCRRHHHLVHELGWRLELAPDRELTIRQPDGNVFAVEPLQLRSTQRGYCELHDLTQRARERVAALRRC
jgi:hypothetical protein